MSAHDADPDPARAYVDAVRTDAAKARERERRRYGPRRGPSGWIYWTIAAVGLVLFAVLMRAVMEKTRWTAGPTPAAPPRVTAPVPAVRPGCLVRASPDSRVYIDRCGGPPLTPQERRALQRQADAGL